MIQAPRKSNGIELSYEQHASIDDLEPRERVVEAREFAAREPDPELARLHAQLRQVRAWAESGEWRESGSDGLYPILSEAAEASR